MDELKNRAAEKIEALHSAARSVAGDGTTKVTDAYTQTVEVVQSVLEFIYELCHHDIIVQSRDRVVNWVSDAIVRIEEGTTPLSPFVLYEELVALCRDRLWRRSMIIFISGFVCGISVGVMVGIGWCRMVPTGPHCRALTSTYDASVLLVNDHMVPGVGTSDVLVRVQAFSVCPVDRSVLRGRGATLRSLLYNTHVTVGRGFAGVVLDAGAAVSSLELGDEVWGCVTEWTPGAGTELLVVSSGRVSKRPRGLAADAAASLPWAGGAALAAIDKLGYTKDTNNMVNKRVCIVGASTAEGCVLSQLSAARGAHVTVAAQKSHHSHLLEIGASEAIELCSSWSPNCWSALEHQAAVTGPWDCVLLCTGTGKPAGGAVLRSTAPRSALSDLRPRTLLTDRIPSPLSIVLAATFHAFRALRWMCGRGTHTLWLEERHRLTSGLQELTESVDSGDIAPVLDKVFLPEDFESALAHACSEDALGTTVIRFP